MKKIILETLKENDLFMLVDDVIMIDVYESKFDPEKYIVVAFSVKTKDAAEDLRSFIQIACASEIFVVDESEYFEYDLDSYIVFAEFERTIDFPDKLLAILEKLSFLCGIKSWKMKINNLNRLFKVTHFNLKKYVSFTLVHESKGKTIQKILEERNIRYNKPFTRYFSFNDDIYSILILANEKDVNYYLADFLKENSRDLLEEKFYSLNPNFIISKNYLLIREGEHYPFILLSRKVDD